MAEAFQDDAFQNDAFQIDVAPATTEEINSYLTLSMPDYSKESGGYGTRYE